jgi:hypothetical protein
VGPDLLGTTPVSAGDGPAPHPLCARRKGRLYRGVAGLR